MNECLEGRGERRGQLGAFGGDGDEVIEKGPYSRRMFPKG